jgi:hypothetical protein
MKESAAEFFSLPLESKNVIAVPEDDDRFQGFGYHFSSAPGKLDWAECVVLVTQPVHARKPELWPTDPPSFRSVFMSIIKNPALFRFRLFNSIHHQHLNLSSAIT